MDLNLFVFGVIYFKYLNIQLTSLSFHLIKLFVSILVMTLKQKSPRLVNFSVQDRRLDEVCICLRIYFKETTNANKKNPQSVNLILTLFAFCLFLALNGHILSQSL